MTAYEQGFIDKCAERGIDPVKLAQLQSGKPTADDRADIAAQSGREPPPKPPRLKNPFDAPLSVDPKPKLKPLPNLFADK